MIIKVNKITYRIKDSLRLSHTPFASFPSSSLPSNLFYLFIFFIFCLGLFGYLNWNKTCILNLISLVYRLKCADESGLKLLGLSKKIRASTMYHHLLSWGNNAKTRDANFNKDIEIWWWEKKGNEFTIHCPVTRKAINLGDVLGRQRNYVLEFSQ